MKPQKQLIVVLLVIAMVTLACGVNLTIPEDAIEVGDLITEELDVAVPNPGEATKLTIEFGAGELFLSPGAGDSLVTGTATYNIEDLKPGITTSGTSVNIDQGSFDYEFTGIPNLDDVENIWDFKLGNTPMDFELRSGAFTGEIELGGLSIQDLTILGGASKIILNFSEPNNEAMSVFRFTSGASDVELNGLANANFSLMDFDAAAGSYELDFSGELMRDASIDIDGGLAQIVIKVPAGIPAVVNFASGFSNVTTSGEWSGDGSTYTQDGEGPTLTFNVKVGAGNLRLEN